MKTISKTIKTTITITITITTTTTITITIITIRKQDGQENDEGNAFISQLK